VTSYAGLLGALAGGRVEFIIVGGVAATAHGAARLTQDIDIVYARTPENIERLAESLRHHAPYLRGAPRDLPFEWSTETIRRGLNFTLTTSLGDIDLLGEIAGGGDFARLLPHTIRLELFGHPCLCLDLPTLVRVKRAAGRPKDFEAIAELEALLEEQGTDAG
jgi:hypothetical protein